MNITVNGKHETLSGKTTLLEFIEGKGLVPDTVVVQLNDEIVKRDQWNATSLKDDDALEIVRFVGGG